MKLTTRKSFPRKRKLRESLTESYVYKPIRDSRQESCRESRIGLYAWLLARLSPRLVFFRGLSYGRLLDKGTGVKFWNDIYWELTRLRKMFIVHQRRVEKKK